MTITTIANFKKYPKKIFQRIRQMRWREGVYCVHCGTLSIKLHQRKQTGLYRYRCNDCKRYFSDLSKTIFEGTKIPLWKWFFALYETGQKSGISSIELADKISVNQKTAWRMLDKIRTSFLNYRPILRGMVEGDETYVGGKTKRQKRKMYQME